MTGRPVKIDIDRSEIHKMLGSLHQAKHRLLIVMSGLANRQASLDANAATAHMDATQRNCFHIPDFSQANDEEIGAVHRAIVEIECGITDLNGLLDRIRTAENDDEDA